MSKLEADIIIIAGGAAGLSAAIAAAQAGADVIIFEKGATTGGTGNMGMGPLGIESRHTRLKQFAPTKDEAFEVFMDYTHWRVDGKLVKVNSLGCAPIQSLPSSSTSILSTPVPRSINSLKVRSPECPSLS